MDENFKKIVITVVTILFVVFLINSFKLDLTGDVYTEIPPGKAIPKVAGGGVRRYSSGVAEDIPLGANISDAQTYTLDQKLADDDISSLIDGTIFFQDAYYDVEELLIINQKGNPVTVETSLTASEDDYQTDIVLEVAKDSIKYYYAFSETIQLNKVTFSDPLEIKFLGKTIKITDVDETINGKFAAYVGDEYLLYSGDSVILVGKVVKLIHVGSGGSINIKVDGVTDFITAGSTKTINEIEIVNIQTFYDSNNQAASAAKLIIGKEALATYKDGDAYIGEDKDDPDWIWNIGNLNEKSVTTPHVDQEFEGPYIGVENDFIWNDDSDNPAKVGDCIDLPNNYLSICLDSLTVEDGDYATYTFEYEDSADFSDVDDFKTSEKAIWVHTTQTEGLVIDQADLTKPNADIPKDIKTSNIWLYVFGSDVVSIFYKDTIDNNVKLAGDVVTSGDVPYFGHINYANTKDSDIGFRISKENDVYNLELVPYHSTNLIVTEGVEYFMNSGDSVVVDGKTVKLARVGSAGAVVIDVDGVQETIPSAQTETVNGIEIKNDETFYDSNNQAASAATLIIEEDVVVTIRDEDAYIDENIIMSWGVNNGRFNSLGSSPSFVESDELTWTGTNRAPTTAVSIGTKDEDHRSRYGIIIRDPKSHGASDEVVLEIPGDQVQANIVIKGLSGDITPPSINILNPIDGSTIKADSVWLHVETNENAVCSYTLERCPVIEEAEPVDCSVYETMTCQEIIDYDDNVLNRPYVRCECSDIVEICNFACPALPSRPVCLVNEPIEIPTTKNGLFHSMLIEDLIPWSEYTKTKNTLTVSCKDSSNNVNEDSVTFIVDLSGLEKYLILHDIEDYKYVNSDMFEYPEDSEIVAVYSATYDRDYDDCLYKVNIIQLKEFLAEEFIEKLGVEMYIQNINGQNIYVLTQGYPQFMWPHENFVVFIRCDMPIKPVKPGPVVPLKPMVVDIDEVLESIPEERIPIEPKPFVPPAGPTFGLPLPLIKAYLERYPSDLIPTDEIKYSITLNEGWNLISVPLILSDNSIETVMADIKDYINVIYSYDPSITEKWEVWRKDSEIANTLLIIEPGKAYWIKMNQPDILNVSGTIDIKKEGIPGVIPTFNVYQGWNLIGYYGTRDEKVSTALQNIDKKYSAIWTLYKYNTQSLQGTLKGVNFEEEFKLTHGYWIFLKEDGVIVPTS